MEQNWPFISSPFCGAFYLYGFIWFFCMYLSCKVAHKTKSLINIWRKKQARISYVRLLLFPFSVRLLRIVTHNNSSQLRISSSLTRFHLILSFLYREFVNSASLYATHNEFNSFHENLTARSLFLDMKFIALVLLFSLLVWI